MATSNCPTCSFQSFVPQQFLSEQKVAHFRDLLRAHGEPPDSLKSTVAEITTELQRYSAELSRCDTELARLHAARVAVARERSTVAAECAAIMSFSQICVGFQAPIRRLPVEILLKIFQISSKPYANTRTLWTRNHRAALAPLFTLSQVCARWHDVVMHNASLWTTVEIPHGLWNTHFLHPGAPEKMMLSLVTRAGQLPLDVVLSDYTEGPLSSALELLMDQSHRWKSAVLLKRAADPHRLSKQSMPLLESLELRCNGFQVEAPHRNQKADFLTAAPKLTRLVVSGALLSTIPTNLKQLHTLECVAVGMSIVAVLPLLSGLSAGATCRLELVVGLVPSRLILHPTSSDIHTLAVEFSSPPFDSVASSLVKGLTLPRLQTLAFRSTHTISWPHAPFLALSSRSSFSEHLISLDLSRFAITPAELIEFVSSLRVLKRLEIADGRPEVESGRGRGESLLTDAVLSNLTSHSNSLALPSLRRFTCHESRLAFTDSVLLDFISSRCPSDGAPAFECSVFWLGEYQRDLDSDVEAQLRELKGDGALVWAFAAEKTEEQG
ncbi:hypothetical protein FB45DRAFT_899448 [Roridomyces roridus]|uniref:F-box domain-containing protein n=1 Tax=Roridomyces roridus TaxID=1738132 RepID=A0AAD7C773_9AGAR|nr:hypothetical protein FB45DRAFT_899448 [Roridomyces roridus]